MVQMNSKGDDRPDVRSKSRRGANRWWKAILGLIGILFLSSTFLGVVVRGSSSSNSTTTSTTPAMPDYSLAYKQSYGFFDDITNENWKLLQSMVVDHENHKYPEAPLTHNPAFDKRKEPWNNSGPAWYQNVSPMNCSEQIWCAALRIH